MMLTALTDQYQTLISDDHYIKKGRAVKNDNDAQKYMIPVPAMHLVTANCLTTSAINHYIRLLCELLQQYG